MDGIILAGGQSRRFGYPKTFLPYQGKPFYQWAIDRMQPFVDQIYFVTLQEHLPYIEDGLSNVHLMVDEPSLKGKGPLAGIFSAMNASNQDCFVTMPIDTPQLEGSVLHQLCLQPLDSYDARIPIVNGKLQPLIGLFHRSVHAVIREQLTREQYSMQALVRKISVDYVMMDQTMDRYFHNINTKEAYDQMTLDEYKRGLE
ncbi:molybdopterin-guanine dinucleotide biosynthesis protein A [Gracilibacillus halophilus YIM-C55.5]|uniref:Probable molybdenum cofactor guanylyltransferase n=1 Tax=Gracilibacillus halophilus YIM-C55.5 TaxID=1308866 RepID=N4WRW6_9BACI|nr:molybdenum cofactor guanylyltransferase [Gracilibacillus halophilus]ENH95936.1 molybdopterin-guanine dinucleotide biosynthesis protein A [Gracilibacillus halophilus YIM-C55.5]